MKLQRKEWNGNVSYKLGMMNAKGVGLTIEDTLVGTLVFDPRITKKGHVFKSGKTLGFDTGSVVLKMDDDSKYDFEYNQFGNVQIEFPSSLISKLEAAKKGDTIKVGVEEVKYENDEGKKVTGTKYTFSIIKENEDSVPIESITPKVLKIKQETIDNVKKALDDGSLKPEDIIEVTLEDDSKTDIKAGDVFGTDLKKF